MRLFLTTLVTAAAISCKDEQGENVGSWVLLKLPQSTSYIYNFNTFQSPYSLNDTTQGALTHTIQQLWTPNTNYVLYNDEPPYETSYNFSSAHAKATLIWDSETAIAIMHSIPKFPVGPAESSEYIGLLPNAWEYAQHVACVSVSLQDLPAFSASLKALNPHIYEGAFPTTQSINPQTCQYHTVGDRMLITKPANYEADIWSTCISQHFQTNLQVMSWIHGTMDGTVTNGTTTSDIAQLTYSFGVTYTEWENHAKWAIGTEPLVCVGDLNRVETQKVRSGAALCWKDPELWAAWNAIV
jgi:deoxyribonuclease-2